MTAQNLSARRLDLPCALFAGATVISLFLPVAAVEGGTSGWFDHPPMVAAAAIALAAAVWRLRPPQGGMIAGLLVAGAAVAGAYAPLAAIAEQSALGLKSGPAIGLGATGVWLYLAGLGFLAWRALQLLSEAAAGGASSAKRLIRLLVPGLFGAWLIYLWQVLVTGFGVPQILLPSPQMIGGVILGATGTLWADFYQTFVKAVLSGFALGCGAGFIVAILVDRVPFLQRGLLPLGNLVSALPIVGVAPIMVMWFGFDWQSKAAVVVVMTFFPMLVNTLAGLAATGAMERDLMRSYGASYLQTLVRVRLVNALPFIFNALKINSTLALIGAIVAEFFGTPTVGMGFRISTEVGRMNVDMVWATIAVAALSGSLFYGLLAVLERSLTFWHPSYRQ